MPKKNKKGTTSLSSYEKYNGIMAQISCFEDLEETIKIQKQHDDCIHKLYDLAVPIFYNYSKENFQYKEQAAIDYAVEKARKFANLMQMYLYDLPDHVIYYTKNPNKVIEKVFKFEKEMMENLQENYSSYKNKPKI